MRAARLLPLLVLVGLLGAAGSTEARQEKDRKEPEKKTGAVVGKLTAKGENWIEVKADGEEKARRYVPHWIGGAPAQGGGLDKKTIALIRTLIVDSRVRVTWTFEERLRIDKVEVLKKAEPKEKDKGDR